MIHSLALVFTSSYLWLNFFTVEIFIKDPDEYKLAQGVSNFERIELFALASLEKYEISKDETMNISLTYPDSITIVNVFIRMMHYRNINMIGNAEDV